MLGRVASALAEHKVNIGTAAVSDGNKDGHVTSIMQLDKKLSPDLLKKVKQLADVSEVHLVHLDD